MTTLTLPPTFPPPVATELYRMKACERANSYSPELIDDSEGATENQLMAKDNGKPKNSREKDSNMARSSAAVIEFDELLERVTYEPDAEPVHDFQVVNEQEPNDHNLECTSQQKLTELALNSVVSPDDAPSSYIKRIVSLLKWMKRYRRINEKTSPKEVDRQKGMLDSNTVDMLEVTKNRKLMLGDNETFANHQDDSTDTETLNSEYYSDYKSSSEGYLGEIHSLTESSEVSVPKLHSSLLEDHSEVRSLTVGHGYDQKHGSEIDYRDAVISIDSSDNFIRSFDSSLPKLQTAIGSSASEHDSDDETSAERCYRDAVTIIDSSYKSAPELHPSLLNSLPQILGLPPDEYESDYDTSTELYFGEVVSLEESDTNSMSKPDPSLNGNTEVGGRATEKKNNLVEDSKTQKSDSSDTKGKTSFDKDISGSEGHEEFEDTDMDMKRMFQSFESLLEVKDTDKVFVRPCDKPSGDKMVG